MKHTAPTRTTAYTCQELGVCHGRPGPGCNCQHDAAHDTAEAIDRKLKSLSVKEIMEQGLHDFLEDFISHNSQLGQEISDGYRFYS